MMRQNTIAALLFSRLLVTSLLLGAGASPCIAGPTELTQQPATAAGDGDLDDFISQLEGGWSGPENTTPFGPMSMVMVFEKTETGGLLAHSPLNRETYIRIELDRDDKGRWILTEEAAMEGLGVQRYELVPAAATANDGTHRWIWQENPEFLAIDLAIQEDILHFDVELRSEPHVSFRLARVPDRELEPLRAELAAQADLPGDGGHALREVMAQAHKEDDEAAHSDPVKIVRASVAAEPENAHHHLALAKVLGGEMERDPATGPRYAFEMKQSLERAIELDPKLVEAYHWLVGYYLEAPPIAGGSLEAARATAMKLNAFAPEAAAGLLQRIDANGP